MATSLRRNVVVVVVDVVVVVVVDIDVVVVAVIIRLQIMTTTGKTIFFTSVLRSLKNFS